MKAVLRPGAAVFGSLVEMRNWLFDNGFFHAAKSGVPVVSIGNLTVGGTGKTPFSLWLLRRQIAKGRRPAFVSRGYGRRSKGIQEVNRLDAKEFGDEPVQLKELLPDIPVWVGADRARTVEQMRRHSEFDFVVADDAFQHRWLQRDLDIVVLDAMESPENYRFLPLGRAREPWESLRRAQIVVLSKANLATKEQFQFLKDKVSSFPISILEAGYEVKSLQSDDGLLEISKGLGVLLVSGVGRPDGVEMTARTCSHVLQHKIYRDHHNYSAEDVEEILRTADGLKVDRILTTYKDAVKLRSFEGLRSRLCWMDLELNVKGDVDELDRKIDRLVRPNS